MRGIYRINLSPSLSVTTGGVIHSYASYLVGGCCMAINNIYPQSNCSDKTVTILIPRNVYVLSEEITEKEVLHWIKWGEQLGINAVYQGIDIHFGKFFGDEGPVNKYYKINIPVIGAVNNSGNRYALYCLSFFRYLFNSTNQYRKIYEVAIALEKVFPKASPAELFHLAHRINIAVVGNYTSGSGDNPWYSTYYGVFSPSLTSYAPDTVAMNTLAKNKFLSNVCTTLGGGTAKTFIFETTLLTLFCNQISKIMKAKSDEEIAKLLGEEVLAHLTAALEAGIHKKK